jgi:hypothetical protein
MITKQQALHKAEEQFSELVQMVDQAIQDGWRVDELERSSFAKLLDLGYQLLTAFVAAQRDGNAGPEVVHRGETWQRLPETHRRRYASIYGPLEIFRFVYGTREGQEIKHVPLDARLGLPAGEPSYVLEDCLERMCVKDAFRESVDSLVDLLGVRAKVSVETAEKHSQEMSRYAGSFRASQPLPPSHEEGEVLVATADAKGVPMRRLRGPQSPPQPHRRRRKEKRPTRSKWPMWEPFIRSIAFPARPTKLWMNCFASNVRKIDHVLSTNMSGRR